MRGRRQVHLKWQQLMLFCLIFGVIELTWTTRTVDGLPFSQRQSLDMIESTRRPKTLPRQNFVCSVLSWHVCPVQQYNLSTSVRRCAGCLRILGKINQTI